MNKTGKPRTEVRKQYQHDWYIEHQDEVKERVRNWGKSNREKANALSKAWNKRNPEKRHLIQMRHRLRKKYGIDPDLYFEMLKKQNNLCAICGEPEDNSTGTSRLLSVDHNHKTGQIRSLLCKACNLGIGNMKESVERLIAAANYLKEWDAKA